MALGVGSLGGACHEGGALMNGNLVLIEETAWSSLTSSAMWGHKELMAVCNPQEGSW